MERRRATRITGGYKVELNSEGAVYSGEVENLSEDGVCVILFPTSISVKFEPGMLYEMKLYSFEEETLNFRCRVKWIARDASHGLTNRIGMELVDPPWDESNHFL